MSLYELVHVCPLCSSCVRSAHSEWLSSLQIDNNTAAKRLGKLSSSILCHSSFLLAPHLLCRSVWFSVQGPQAAASSVWVPSAFNEQRGKLLSFRTEKLLIMSCFWIPCRLWFHLPSPLFCPFFSLSLYHLYLPFFIVSTSLFHFLAANWKPCCIYQLSSLIPVQTTLPNDFLTGCALGGSKERRERERE